MKSVIKIIIITAAVWVAAASSVEVFASDGVQAKRFKPEWSDLDTRSLPEWYDKAKIGIFIHWGVYAVPSFGSEWFWDYWKGNGNHTAIEEFMKKNYKPGFSYQEFAPMFTAEFFDPESWAKLFADAGAKYVVLTTKHHDGFTLFPSKRSFSWNAMDVGPKRDIVRDLSTAVRNHSLKFGVYHSLYEWFNPIYLLDKKNNFTTHMYSENKLWPDIKQLVEEYQPSVLWSDGDWETTDQYWKSTELIAWLYNDSPVKDEIVVNDRWGQGTPCKHGDFYNCEDRYNPQKLMNHKWENAFTIDKKSWGYRRQLSLEDVMTDAEILEQVVSTVSCGGNVLINVGPKKEGTIPVIFQERLLNLGKWLKINGEAIYETLPWVSQNDTLNGNVWYTCTKEKEQSLDGTVTNEEITAIYAIFLEWPERNILKVHDLTTILRSGVYKVQFLGDSDDNLQWVIKSGVSAIQLPDKTNMTSQLAWVLKITDK